MCRVKSTIAGRCARLRMDSTSVVVIGAGMGGLAAAIRLAAAGLRRDRGRGAGRPGRQDAHRVDSAAGPVDAGPTVLTLRQVFDDLFAAAGERLDDHVTLSPQPVLARHWWPDGAPLDLTPTPTPAPPPSAPSPARAPKPTSAASTAWPRGLYRGLRRAGDAGRPPRPCRHRRPTSLRTPALWPALCPGCTLAALAGARSSATRACASFSAAMPPMSAARPSRRPASWR